MKHYLFIAIFVAFGAHASIDFENLTALGSWERTELEELLDPATYQGNLNFVQQEFHAKFINELSELNLNYGDAKQLTSLFIAFVNIIAKPFYYSLSEDIREAISQATDNDFWNQAAIDVNISVGRPAQRQINYAARTQISAALANLQLTGRERYQAELKLCEIFFFAYMKQDIYLEHFIAAYNSARTILSSDINFLLTSEEVVEHIKQPTWNNVNADIAEHPLITMLKSIMTIN